MAYKTGELAFTDKEVALLIQKAPSREDELIILMGIGTGLRREDMAEVLISNIDLREGTLTFHEHKKDKRDRETHKIIEEQWRTIPLTPNLQEAIRKYLPGLPRDQTRLFPMTGRTLFNRLQKMCDHAEIPRRPVHALRATLVKRAQRAKWPPEAVAKLTGDTLNVINAHYAVPSMAEMKELAKEKDLI